MCDFPYFSAFNSTRILLNKSYLHYTPMLLLTLIFSLVLVQDFKLVFTSSALGEIMLSSSEMD